MSATDGRVDITKARAFPSPAKAALLRLKALVDRAGDPRDLLAIATVLRELIELRADRDELRALRAAATVTPTVEWGVRHADGEVEHAGCLGETRARGLLIVYGGGELVRRDVTTTHVDDVVVRGDWQPAP